MRQARFNRLKMFLRLLPLLERQAESIQLRFEFGETLFEVRTLLMHDHPARAIVAQKCARRSSFSR